MPTKSSLPHWNYLDKSAHPRMDFTNLDRMPLSNDPVLRALQERVNAQSERLELLFIEIEIDRMEREEAQAETPKKRTKKRTSKRELFEDIDEATRAELEAEGFDLE